MPMDMDEQGFAQLVERAVRAFSEGDVSSYREAMRAVATHCSDEQCRRVVLCVTEALGEGRAHGRPGRLALELRLRRAIAKRGRATPEELRER